MLEFSRRKMRAFWTAGIVVVGLASLGAGAPGTTLYGYSALESAQERLTESRFIDLPSAQNARETATAVGARPHYAGTTADHDLALYMRDRMRSYGLSAELETLRARVDTPRELVLELAPPAELVPQPGRARQRDRHAAFPIALDLAEAGIPSDPATMARAIGLPFNAGSGDGDVSAPLVYAGRGREADYEMLAHAHVDVRGAVVLLRYGAEFRGLLAERAQARGVAGVIFYNDPQDDGPARGSVSPDGPWRPAAAVERGWLGTGIRIPTLPVSAANAAILLGSLAGSTGPPAWSGGLPVIYPLARGPGRVHLIVKLNRKLTTLWNTLGTVPGVHGDQTIILGAHRDAWVYGVGDNGAGVATMLEVARSFGFLLRGGWRPQRTIVIAGWDGGEIGSLGSQAYAALHHVDLERGCFAYLNADANVTGVTFGADSVAAIAPVIVDVARSVRDPLAPATTIYDRWSAQTPDLVPHADAPVGGSDHESFLTTAGTPVAAMNFSGPFGVYHSAYDTLLYATRVSDPDFSLHRAAAQLYGVVALRLADADRVPYIFAGYVPLLRSGVVRLAARASATQLHFDSAVLTRSIDRLGFAAASFDRAGAPPPGDVAPGELRAARELDALGYGVAGYANGGFAEIDAALTTRDAGLIDAAIRRAAAAVDRATMALPS